MRQWSDVDESSRLFEAIGRLGESRDPEVVLLRGHLAVERTLAEAVAARLHVPVGKLPGLGFQALARLSTSDEAEQQELTWFNELRNCMAHELDALNSSGFRTLVGHFSVPWPSGPLERSITLELIAKKLFYAALAVSLRWRLRSRPEGVPYGKFEREAKRILRRFAVTKKHDEKLAQDLRDFLDSRMASRKDIERLEREIRAHLKDFERVIKGERKKIQKDLELLRSESWEELISRLRPPRPLTSVD